MMNIVAVEHTESLVAGVLVMANVTTVSTVGTVGTVDTVGIIV